MWPCRRHDRRLGHRLVPAGHLAERLERAEREARARAEAHAARSARPQPAAADEEDARRRLALAPQHGPGLEPHLGHRPRHLGERGDRAALEHGHAPQEEDPVHEVDLPVPGVRRPGTRGGPRSGRAGSASAGRWRAGSSRAGCGAGSGSGRRARRTRRPPSSSSVSVSSSATTCEPSGSRANRATCPRRPRPAPPARRGRRAGTWRARPAPRSAPSPPARPRGRRRSPVREEPLRRRRRRPPRLGEPGSPESIGTRFRCSIRSSGGTRRAASGTGQSLRPWREGVASVRSTTRERKKLASLPRSRSRRGRSATSPSSPTWCAATQRSDSPPSSRISPRTSS